jgi:hypothetical protein
MLINRAQLDLSAPFGSGGQGAIYEIDPAIASSIGWSGPIVAKLYRSPLPESDLHAFIERVRWASSLASEARAELHEAAAWPLMVIEERGALAGIVMSDQRERFEVQMQLPSGATEAILMSLEHLLGDDAYLERRFGLTCDTRVRAALAERLAAALAVLHRHAIVASDISQKNVLVRLIEPYAVTLIDCDSMTFRGGSTLKLVETPDWEIPEEWGELPATRGADAYKLGLAIMRLFARDQSQRDPRLVEPYVPTALHQLLMAALGSQPRLRPSAGRWQAALRDVLATPLAKDFPGPPPRSLKRSTSHRVQRPGPQPAATPAGRIQGAPIPGTATGVPAPPIPGTTTGIPTSPTTGPIARPVSPVAPGMPPLVQAPGGSPPTGAGNRRLPLTPPSRIARARRSPTAMIMAVLLLFAFVISARAVFSSSGSTSGPSTTSISTTASRLSTSSAQSSPAPSPRPAPGVESSPASPAHPTHRRARTSHTGSAQPGRSRGSSAGSHAGPSSGHRSSSHSSINHSNPVPSGSAGLQGSAESPPPSASHGTGHGGGGLEGSAQGESSSGGAEGGLSGSSH